MNEWSELLVTILRKMWREGKSASLISAEVNRTRSAVLGKVHRLGLSHESRREEHHQVTKRKSTQAKLERAAPQRALPAVEPSPTPWIQFPLSRTWAGDPIDLFSLTNETCRWPIDHPDGRTFFCASPTADLATGRPYCTEHTLRAAPQTALPRIKVSF